MAIQYQVRDDLFIFKDGQAVYYKMTAIPYVGMKVRYTLLHDNSKTIYSSVENITVENNIVVSVSISRYEYLFYIIIDNYMLNFEYQTEQGEWKPLFELKH